MVFNSSDFPRRTKIALNGFKHIGSSSCVLPISWTINVYNRFFVSFRCQVIEKGEQLFLDHVYFDANQRSPLNYIAGKIGGVNYEKL